MLVETDSSTPQAISARPKLGRHAGQTSLKEDWPGRVGTITAAIEGQILQSPQVVFWKTEWFLAWHCRHTVLWLHWSLPHAMPTCSMLLYGTCKTSGSIRGKCWLLAAGCKHLQLSTLRTLPNLNVGISCRYQTDSVARRVKTRNLVNWKSSDGTQKLWQWPLPHDLNQETLWMRDCHHSWIGLRKTKIARQLPFYLKK